MKIISYLCIRIKKIKVMRFYEEWGGFIWEYNSFWEYIQALIGRVLGTIIGLVIVIGGLYLIGKYCG